MADYLTVRDIAALIQRPGEPLTAAVDRLRNWTDMGLIKPTGERHPGTGRKKRYSGDALRRTVILQLLIDATGAPASGLTDLLEECCRMARRITPEDLIVISRQPGATAIQAVITRERDIAKFLHISGLDVHTVIHMGRFFNRLKQAQGK